MLDISLSNYILSLADNYTLLIKSDSEVAQLQPQLLGVYRLVDSYNDRSYKPPAELAL